MNSKKRLLLTLVLIVLLITGVSLWVLLRQGLAIGLWAQRNSFENLGLENQTVDSTLGPQSVFANVDSDAPTLVMIHGFGDQAATWSGLAAELIERYRIIAPDLPGHGDSAPDGSALSYDDLYHGLVQSVAAIAGDSRFILIGNSLGGWLSMRYALDHPQRVDRLILVNAAGLSQAIDKEILIPQTREAVNEKMRRMFPPEALPRLPGFAQDQLIAMTDLPRFDSLFDSLESSKPLDDELPSLEVPTHLIWGTPDGFFPLDYAERLKNAIPGAQLHELPGCGHVPQMVCSDRMLSLLEEIFEQESQPSAGLDAAMPDDLEEPDSQ